MHKLVCAAAHNAALFTTMDAREHPLEGCIPDRLISVMQTQQSVPMQSNKLIELPVPGLLFLVGCVMMSTLEMLPAINFYHQLPDWHPQVDCFVVKFRACQSDLNHVADTPGILSQQIACSHFSV